MHHGMEQCFQYLIWVHSVPQIRHNKLDSVLIHNSQVQINNTVTCGVDGVNDMGVCGDSAPISHVPG